MEPKSHTPEEFQLELINKLEALTRQIDKLNETVKRNCELTHATNTATKELKDVVSVTNKTFEQVSQYLKDIYSKIQALDLVQKLIGNFGPMFKKQ